MRKDYFYKFNSINDYESFKNSEAYITPNVCSIVETNEVFYNEYVPPMIAGDLAYWDGSSVKTVAYSKYKTVMGTPIGVVVIPKGILPDGKARIVSLRFVSTNGAQSAYPKAFVWGEYGVDTSLNGYNKVSITDNQGSTTIGSGDNGYLPSDKYDAGYYSYSDPKSRYYTTTNFIPSTYSGETLNNEYCYDIPSLGNALSDFNGLANTETLQGLGSAYKAANACWKYKDGYSNLQWHLPSEGELGFLFTRYKAINETLDKLGKSRIDCDGDVMLWSSTEKGHNKCWTISTMSCLVDFTDKDTYATARPFAVID